MNSSPSFASYRPSGKVPVPGPLYALGLALGLGFPMGFLYAYLNYWIPFIYLRLLITLGFGTVLGFLTIVVVRRARIRNIPAAGLLGAATGAIGMFYAWNAHFHTLVDDMPLLLSPAALWEAIQFLNSVGSWAFKSSDNVTGIALTLVWAAEAFIVLGFAAFLPWQWVRDNPYCETSKQWLMEKKTIDALQPFLASEEIAALRRGDLGPLTQAKPRDPGAASWARLTIKRATQPSEFCTVRIDNVDRVADRRGQMQDKVTPLTKDLMLPHAMMALMEKFEQFEARAETPEEPPLAQAS